MTVVFNEGVLNNGQTLPIEQEGVKDFIGKIVNARIEPDKRFVYYLLGSTGICTVPLTSFFTDLPGFRITLLEKDASKFEGLLKKLAENIVQYVESALP
jgi:aspartate/methionine/tyrosine aminotransferase